MLTLRIWSGYQENDVPKKREVHHDKNIIYHHSYVQLRSLYKKCIDSLILPDPLMEQIEILVVNDGSTDACEELVKPYTRDYPESVFLYNKENGGHGSVINYAIPFCHGKYVKVLDADDWFQTGELEKLITCLQTEKPADLILTPFLTFDLSTQSYAATGATNQAHRITMSQIIKHWSYCKRICCFHGLTYRTQFYKKYAFMLPEKVFYDDAFYCTLPAYMQNELQSFQFLCMCTGLATSTRVYL